MSKSKQPQKKAAPAKKVVTPSKAASKSTPSAKAPPVVKKSSSKAPAPVKKAASKAKAPAPAKVPAKKAAPVAVKKAKPSPAPAKKAAVKAPAPKAKAPAAKSTTASSKSASKPVATKAPAPSAKQKQPTKAPVKKAAAPVVTKPKTAVAVPAVQDLPPPTPPPEPPPVLTNEPAPVTAAVIEAPAPTPIAVEAPVAKAPATPSKKASSKNAPPPPHVSTVQNPRTPTLSAEKPVATKSGALFYDSHMHTPLCKHAWGDPEEYAQQGIKSGLKGIIFTCHCPMPEGFWPTVRMSDSEFDTYLAIVQRTKEAYKGKIEVCLGLESEYYPGCETWIEALHQRADFDYILGAVHWQAKEYLNKYETGTIENFRRTYFEHLAQSAESGLYDCLAHPDLVKNYHPDSWCFAIIKNTVSTVLDRIAKTGVAMELNTSGLNKSYHEMNPGNEMLRMMAERNIPIVLGSDSHRAARVGEHFVTALNNLSEAGFEHVNYFQKRERIQLKISDVLASIKRATDANA